MPGGWSRQNLRCINRVTAIGVVTRQLSLKLTWHGHLPGDFAIPKKGKGFQIPTIQYPFFQGLVMFDFSVGKFSHPEHLSPNQGEPWAQMNLVFVYQELPQVLKRRGMIFQDSPLQLLLWRHRAILKSNFWRYFQRMRFIQHAIFQPTFRFQAPENGLPYKLSCIKTKSSWERIWSAKHA